MSNKFEIENYESDGITLVEYNKQENETEVVIPEGVNSIGTYVFEGYSNLTNITLPNSLKKIDNFAFYKCSGLKKVILPNSLQKIGDKAFGICPCLTEIVIPDSVRQMGSAVFSYCTSLTNITIKSANIIMSDINCFFGCDNLKTVNISSYNVFHRLDYYSKLVALNTILRDKKQGQYEKEDLEKFKQFIINSRYSSFWDMVMYNNLIDLLNYLLKNVLSNDEIETLIDKCVTNDRINVEMKAYLLEFKRNIGFKNIENRFNLYDDDNEIIRR